MTLAEALLNWYDLHRRTLPWRGTRDPYRIWLSEIMLQQTRTETVARYYPRFLEAFPTVFELAQADEDRVLKLWEGLGYYSRARNLHAASKVVADKMSGRFPETSAGLRVLPGIGPYAANAIASIAFDECSPALDGNQARVLSRVLAHEAPLKTPFDLLKPATALMNRQRPGDYNQALMDLGASVCTPKVPDCCGCPIATHCRARAAGDPESFPRKQPPVVKREAALTIVLVMNGSGLYVRRRADKGLLGGMYEFAVLEGFPDAQEIPGLLTEAGFARPALIRMLPPSKHVFTHLIWRMQGALVRAEAAPEDYLWTDSLSEFAIPTALRAYREIAEELLNS